MHIIVLVVNILSLRKTQVSIGNIKYDAPKAVILTDHSSFISSYPIFVAHQKQNKAGRPKQDIASNNLSFQKSQVSWELFWNQINVCPIANRLNINAKLFICAA